MKIRIAIVFCLMNCLSLRTERVLYRRPRERRLPLDSAIELSVESREMWQGRDGE